MGVRGSKTRAISVAHPVPPLREMVARLEQVRVIDAENPLPNRQEYRKRGARSLSIATLPGPVREVVQYGKRVWMISAEHSFLDWQEVSAQVACGLGITRSSNPVREVAPRREHIQTSDAC